MTNRELAEILMKNPEQEVIIPVFNGKVDTYSSIESVINLSASGVYNDMFNTLLGEIDIDLFTKLGNNNGEVTFLHPTLTKRSYDD